MKKIYYISLPLLLIALGCKHDPIEIPVICEEAVFYPADSCHIIPPSPSAFGYDIQPLPFGQRRPVFNPNDPDEILYLHVNSDPFTRFYTELWVLNLCNGKKRYVTDKASFNPDWSIKDWIIFEDYSFQLWKIKSNGDSLTQLTFQHQHNRPRWSPDGNSFLHYQVDRTPNGNLILMDETGNLIRIQDSTLGGWAMFSWDLDGKNYAYASEGGFKIANMENKLIDTFPNISPVGYILGIVWHPNKEEIYWTDRLGIYKTNLETRATQTLLNRCENNKTYVTFSISPDKTQMLVEQHYYTKIGENLVQQEYNLVSLDMDGTNEQRIKVE